jgi:periplasmic protein TonB
VSSELREPTGVLTDTQVRAREKAGKTKLVIGAIAAVLLIAAGLGYFLLRGKGTPPPVTTAAIPAPAAQPDRTALQQQAAAQQAEAARIELQYKELLEKQSKDMQARYDEQLAAMRKEMDSAKQRAQQAQQAADAPAPPPSRPVPAATLASQPVRPAATQAPAPAPSTAPAPAVTTAAAPPPAPAQPEPAQAVLPTDVSTGQAAPSGSTPPKLLARPNPTYPAIAQRIRKEATVVVRVLVDERGRVAQAELKGDQKGFGFDQSALQAAKGARFAAATQGGQPVKMWVDLPIHFKL